MSNEVQFLVSVGYCLFMIVLSIVIIKYPPKKINHLYGYRTPRSMKNQKIWQDANLYSSKLMLKVCLYSLVFPVLGYFIFPQYNLLITVIANTLLICSVVWFTEKYLDAKYDKNGNSK